MTLYADNEGPDRSARMQADVRLGAGPHICAKGVFSHDAFWTKPISDAIQDYIIVIKLLADQAVIDLKCFWVTISCMGNKWVKKFILLHKYKKKALRGVWSGFTLLATHRADFVT